jgi:hypothetical protein
MLYQGKWATGQVTLVHWLAGQALPCLLPGPVANVLLGWGLGWPQHPVSSCFAPLQGWACVVAGVQRGSLEARRPLGCRAAPSACKRGLAGTQQERQGPGSGPRLLAGPAKPVAAATAPAPMQLLTVVTLCGAPPFQAAGRTSQAAGAGQVHHHRQRGPRHEGE